MKYQVVENLVEKRYEIRRRYFNVFGLYEQWITIDWCRWDDDKEKEEALRNALAKMKYYANPNVVGEM